MTLLEIGCGWGLTLKRAMEVRRQRHRPDAVEEPAGVLPAVARQRRQRPDLRRAAGGLGTVPPRRPDRVDRGLRALRLRSATTTSSRTVSTSLPDDGRMTIRAASGTTLDLAARGKNLNFRLARFAVHLHGDLPGGGFRGTAMMVELGEIRRARTRRCAIPSRPSASGLRRPKRNKDQAIAITDEENYNRYAEVPDRLPVLLPRRGP